MKSICFLTHDLMTGGIESVLTDAVKALHKKYEVEVVSLYGGAEQAVVDGFPQDVTVRVGPFCKNKLFDRMKSRPLLSKPYFDSSLQRDYDYIISLKQLERGACFSRWGKHHIYWCHNDSHRHYMQPTLTPALKKQKRLTKLLYKKHDMVWMVNDIVAAEARTVFPVEQICALPNPIDCDAVLEKAKMPCDIRFDQSKINVVLLGRISTEKGFDRIIKMAYRTLCRQFENVHFYLIGGGEALDAFQKTVNKGNLQDRITLLGSKANPFPYLKQADLLVLPSRYESFGLVIMEAMLLGVPVITTDTTGGRYATHNGKYACCIENTDEALLAALEQFFADPKSYSYPRAEAQEWVRQHDVSKFEERLLSLLEQCEEKPGLSK